MVGMDRRSLLRDVFLLLLSAPATSIDITVETSNELFESSPLLYGFMFEDINYSGNGGLHSQLLQNNGFQGDNPDLTAYEAVGDVELSVDGENPLSEAIPNSLAVSFSPDSGDGAGFSNAGYWGIPIDNDNYTTAFYMKGDYTGYTTIQLLSAVDGTEYGSTELYVNSTASGYSYFETSLVGRAAPDGENVWALTLEDGSQTAGNTFNFDLVQLYGTTYKNRANGLKPSLAQPLADIGSSFLRFPGGNNLEGETPDSRWKWNETIGPLKDRPGRQGTWGYPNTDALGLIEYLHWCEDLELTPILDVYGGLSLGGNEGDILTGDALVPYVEDVMNELEYLLGSTDTEYGALRESHGYPEPFVVNHVEIGNEDHLSNGGPTYPERFMAFYDAILEKYPDITIIASNVDYLPDPAPEGMWMDFHTYSPPGDLVEFFTMWDEADRNIPVFVGEYACTSRDDGSPIPLPEMQGSVAEAVFMIGIERNSDVVKMAAYAPLLQNLEGTQWEPDLISFSNLNNDVVLSTSYYVQQLFSTHRGTTILESTSDSEFGPVYWVSSRTQTTTFIKLANYSPDPQEMNIALSGAGNNSAAPATATLRFISGDALDTNSIEDSEEERIGIQEVGVEAAGDRFEFELPGWAVGVLVVEG